MLLGMMWLFCFSVWIIVIVIMLDVVIIVLIFGCVVKLCVSEGDFGLIVSGVVI